MNIYQQLIVEATGCIESEAEEIEELIRLEHPTLDGLSKSKLFEEARFCYKVLKYQKSPCGLAYVLEQLKLMGYESIEADRAI